MPPLIAALACTLILVVLLRYRALPLDTPNERSLHTNPIPRVGGIAVVPSIGIGWIISSTAVPVAIWAPMVLLFLVSLLDDVRGLPVVARLAVHLLAATITGAMLILPHGSWIGAIAAVLFITWTTNLYNFMDGSDGLAAGMALVGFLTYAAAAWAAGDTSLASACACVSAASAAFLWFNFHPARVFLGDAGSIPIGYLAASLGLLGWLKGHWPAWFPLLVFSPFIVDASVTLLRRALRGERVWQAHRDHYYQRLVRLGWGHRRTALAEYVLMSGCSLAALIAMPHSENVQYAVLVALAAGYMVLMVAIDRSWRRLANKL